MCITFRCQSKRILNSDARKVKLLKWKKNQSNYAPIFLSFIGFLL